MPGDLASEGVTFTNLDEPLFAGADATKRDLVDYVGAVDAQILAELRDRPLSVIRVIRGQEPFMQKNVPRYTPPFVRTVSQWAEASKREVAYALCNDRRTLMWFANQRAVEFHPGLVRIDHPGAPSHLVLDIDPPAGDAFPKAVAAAHLVHHVLEDAGLAGAVKTSGAKGLHVFIPVGDDVSFDDVAAAARALVERAARLDPGLATTAFLKEDRAGRVFLDSTRVGSATVVAAYSPRVRPGVPVSFPLGWSDLDNVSPQDFTIHTAAALLDSRNPWRDAMPPAQRLDAALLEEGHAIPIARVQAMHEGKRRARRRIQS